MVDPSFFVAGAITGGVALIASLLSLILGVKNYLLAHRKLTLEEESKQLEVKRLVDKYRWEHCMLEAPSPDAHPTPRLYRASSSARGRARTAHRAPPRPPRLSPRLPRALAQRTPE
jgi:hypothetical protein